MESMTDVSAFRILHVDLVGIGLHNPSKVLSKTASFSLSLCSLAHFLRTPCIKAIVQNDSRSYIRRQQVQP